MKKLSKCKHAVAALLCAAALAGLTACEADPVETARGKHPDKEPLENTYVKVRSVRSSVQRAVVNLTEGSGKTADRMYCRLNRVAEKPVEITAVPDESLVEAYNTAHGTEFRVMPAGNVEIADNGKVTIPVGKRVSDKMNITFRADGLTAGEYLLPVAITSDDASFTEEGRVLYYGVKVRSLSRFENYELDADYLNVFYVNTSIYQPLLADVWMLQKVDYSGWPMETIWERTYGNIVNLRIVQIGYDPATGRAKLVLNSDMRYVLEHADKYIRPLQDKGRKVCLCLEGGSTGLGFCNLTDEQIADFTAQVKACIEQYGLDGVHFFDRNAGYGNEESDLPAMNTTSYPKLIRAMRQALGTQRLVTLADYEEPTAYFWDTEATGGIVVGEYLDYAWSGYMSESEDMQLVDPWQTVDPDDPALSEAEEWGLMLTLPTSVHNRKPIAGLDKSQFGHFAVPFYSSDGYPMDEIGLYNIGTWSFLNWRPNNIVVWADLISNEQSKYEGAWNLTPSSFWYIYPEGSIEGTYGYNMDMLPVYAGEQGIQYDYLKKDW